MKWYDFLGPIGGGIGAAIDKEPIGKHMLNGLLVNGAITGGVLGASGAGKGFMSKLMPYMKAGGQLFLNGALAPQQAPEAQLPAMGPMAVSQPGDLTPVQRPMVPNQGGSVLDQPFTSPNDNFMQLLMRRRFQ